MVYQVPLTYTVIRPFTAHGVAYEKDDVLTTAQAQGLRLGLLVSSKKLRPDIDPHARRGYADIGAQPTYIAPGARPKTSGTITATQQATPGLFNFDASWGAENTRWDFGDGHYSTDNDTTSHLYAANGAYTVKATNNKRTATVTATVNNILIVSVTAGSPGYFSPSGATLPANLTALAANAVVGNSGSNKPTTAWTTGQYVVLGDASQANWNGTAWASGAHALMATTAEAPSTRSPAPEEPKLNKEPENTPAKKTPAKKTTSTKSKNDNVNPGQEGPAS